MALVADSRHLTRSIALKTISKNTGKIHPRMAYEMAINHGIRCAIPNAAGMSSRGARKNRK
jgi:hypothetical protein